MIAERTKQMNSRLLKVAVAIDKALAILSEEDKHYALDQVIEMAASERERLLAVKSAGKGEVTNG